MAFWAVVLPTLYLALALDGRALLQLRSPGSTGLAALVSALEPQVRFVEEPYLLCAHGTDHAAYASRFRRFVPGIGRLETGRIIL